MDIHYHRWSRDEETQLLQLGDSYVCKKGVKKWDAIAEQMGGRRSPTAIKNRYVALKKGVEAPPITTEEIVAALEPEVDDTQEKINSAFKEIRLMALTVAKGLGKGRVEGVYQRALSIELQKKSIAHTMEEIVPIAYDGITVGHERADIHIYNPAFPCILELKATNRMIQPQEHWQAISYMRALNCHYGAVINFNQSQNGNTQIDFIILTDDGKVFLWDPDTDSIMGEPLSDYTD